MDLDQIAEQLRVSDAIVSNAHELFRRASIHSVLGASALAQPAVCIHLAADALSSPFDQVTLKACMRLSGVPSKHYTNTLASLQSLLDLAPKSSVNEIAVRFGLAPLCSRADRIISTFLASLPGIQKQYVDVTRPVYPIVALILAHKLLHAPSDSVRVRMGDLQKAAGCKPAEFTRIKDMMQAACAPLIRDRDSASEEVKGRKRTSSVAAGGSDDEDGDTNLKGSKASGSGDKAVDQLLNRFASKRRESASRSIEHGTERSVVVHAVSVTLPSSDEDSLQSAEQSFEQWRASILGAV